MGRNLWTRWDTNMVKDLKAIAGGDYFADLYEEHVEIDTYNCYNHKTTVVVLKLRSGFEIVGTAGCEDPKKFDEWLGQVYATKDALMKLNEMLGFHRAQASYEKKKADDERLELEKAKRLVNSQKRSTSYIPNHKWEEGMPSEVHLDGITSPANWLDVNTIEHDGIQRKIFTEEQMGVIEKLVEASHKKYQEKTSDIIKSAVEDQLMRWRLENR